MCLLLLSLSLIVFLQSVSLSFDWNWCVDPLWESLCYEMMMVGDQWQRGRWYCGGARWWWWCSTLVSRSAPPPPNYNVTINLNWGSMHNHSVYNSLLWFSVERLDPAPSSCCAGPLYTGSAERTCHRGISNLLLVLDIYIYIIYIYPTVVSVDNGLTVTLPLMYW